MSIENGPTSNPFEDRGPDFSPQPTDEELATELREELPGRPNGYGQEPRSTDSEPSE